jgi:hypothetical protein
MRYVFYKALLFTSLITSITLGSLSASSMIEQSDEQIIKRADYVIYGYVAEIKTLLEKQNTPFQYITIAVERIYKNSPDMPLYEYDQIVIRQIGGEAEGISLDIESLSSFNEDTNVFLSLKQDGNGFFYVVGNSQGHYEMKDGMLVKDHEEESTAFISYSNDGTIKLDHGKNKSMSLEAMEAKVERTIGRGE